LRGLVDELTAFAEAWFREPTSEALPEPPLELLPIWERFREVHEWRGFDRDHNLPRVMSIDTLANWLKVTGGQPLSSFELDVMMRLDGAFWESTIDKGRDGLSGPLKEVAKQEGRIRTVAVNPKKAK